MREILFRGKRRDLSNKKGEWIEGLLCYNIYHQICIQPFKNGTVCVIDPETVGQYTGLTDKNGTKIFEGDICSSGGMIYQIIWLDDKYGWFCKVLKSNSCLIDTTMAFPLYQYDNRPENGYRQLEIIGNIHDNPELLKGGEG